MPSPSSGIRATTLPGGVEDQASPPLPPILAVAGGRSAEVRSEDEARDEDERAVWAKVAVNAVGMTGKGCQKETKDVESWVVVASFRLEISVLPRELEEERLDGWW